MPSVQVKIDSEVYQRLLALKPAYLSAAAFTSQFVETALDTDLKLAKPRATATTGSTSSPVLPLSNNNLNSSSLEEERDIDREPTNPRALGTNPRALGTNPRSTKKIDLFARKALKLSQVPQELTYVAELFVEFWNVKKGTRSQAVFSRVTNKLLAWSRDDQKKALETAITNGWGDVFEPKLDRPKQAPWAEPQMKHPAHRDFTAERLERERNEAEEEIPSATGGRGVLEALGHAF